MPLTALILSEAEHAALGAFLSQTSKQVDAVLDDILPVASAVGDTMMGISRVAECMRYSTFAGGKRMRPALVLASYTLAGGVVPTRALHAGAAMEMIHTYSLIQDDLPSMDNDDLRRGRPTAHKQYDEVTALMASDGLQTGAYELLASAHVHPNPEVRLEVIRLFARSSGALGMVAGQMVDMMWENHEGQGGMPGVGITELAHMNLLKTGVNMIASCEAGAVLAEADAATRKAMVAYGTALGRAFQVYDDVLDVIGTAEQLGKTPGKDAAAGKTTFVSLLGVEGAKRRAREEADTALAALSPWGPEADPLRLLARYCVTRTS